MQSAIVTPSKTSQTTEEIAYDHEEPANQKTTFHCIMFFPKNSTSASFDCLRALRFSQSFKNSFAQAFHDKRSGHAACQLRHITAPHKEVISYDRNDMNNCGDQAFFDCICRCIQVAF